MTHFLHIGKTGGTAVTGALEPVAEACGIVLHKHGIVLREVSEDDTFFFFLRDPVTRFVSSFNSRLRKGRPRYDFVWTEDEAWAFERYRTPNELAEDIGSADARRAMDGIQHVNTRYSVWLDSAAYVRLRSPLLVGRQERLAEDFEELKRRMNISGPELPIDVVARHATPPGFITTLSAKARENVATWYEDDYAILRELEPLWAR